jgi:hypothetical protein
MPEPLPDFPFDAAPRADRCEKCTAGRDADLRFLIVRGRDRYLGRTLCDTCSEEVLEALLLTDTDPRATETRP